MLFNYIQMKIAHSTQHQQNISLIGDGYDSLGKASLASLVGNYWATEGIRVNLSSVKGGLIGGLCYLHGLTFSSCREPRPRAKQTKKLCVFCL